MEIGINIRHQNGATWDDVLAGVQLAEQLGFDAVFFPDHYQPTENVTLPDGSRGTADLVSPTGPSDCWTLIAALVPQTTQIRFGTMMTSSTFRYPGPLAVAVNQVNTIARGRIDLGLGTNWHEPEHSALGIPYPPRRGRFDRLEEQLELITRLWDSSPDEQFSWTGEHFAAAGARGFGRPADVARPRIIVGGSGLVRTPRVAARYADEANSLARTPEAGQAFYDACAAACETIGRDPATLRRSVMVHVTCGIDDADVRRHVDAAGLTMEQVAGTFICNPDQLVERLQDWEASGIERAVISRRGAVDLPSIRMIGELVVPKFR
jgi:alkanesulfonate monooxygenase SsuD/methylene tetrahydromethanopterin reductase-like flavin-dependent oxidoreductase (luciferase family)